MTTRISARLRIAVLTLAVLSLVVNLAGRTFACEGEQHKSVRSGHAEPKRQHLDRDSLDWSTPVATIAPPLWRVLEVQVPPPGEPAIVAVVQSPLYNRPPPTC